MFGLYPRTRRAREKYIRNELQQKRRIDLDEKRYIHFFPLILLITTTAVVAWISMSRYGHWFNARYMMLTGFVIFWPVYSFCRGMTIFVLGMAFQMLLLIFGSYIELSDLFCFFMYVVLPFTAACKEAWVGMQKLKREEEEWN